jgi:hypothetical protein
MQLTIIPPTFNYKLGDTIFFSGTSGAVYLMPSNLTSKDSGKFLEVTSPYKFNRTYFTNGDIIKSGFYHLVSFNRTSKSKRFFLKTIDISPPTFNYKLGDTIRFSGTTDPMYLTPSNITSIVSNSFLTVRSPYTFNRTNLANNKLMLTGSYHLISSNGDYRTSSFILNTITIKPETYNYNLGDSILISVINEPLYLMPSTFIRMKKGFYMPVTTNFTFKDMIFNNGLPVINGTYHFVSLSGDYRSPPFYFNSTVKMNGFYWWTKTMDTNTSGTLNLSSGLDDTNRNPFAMPKNSITTYYPNNITDIVPHGTNSIFLFAEKEYISECLTTIENSYCKDLYIRAGTYFKETGLPYYLFGIAVSGGDLYWDIEKISTLTNNIEKGLIKYGNYDTYIENGLKTKYFNTIVFDLERLANHEPNSGITDHLAYETELLGKFINCFKRIKKNAPWCIVVTMAHSGTFTATNEFINGINECEHVDYFSPQLYTWHYTGCNEYTKTGDNNYFWSDFYKSITTNPQYKYRGASMIVPSLGFNTTSYKVNGFYGTSSIGDGWGNYIPPLPGRLFKGTYRGLYSSAGTNRGRKPFFEVKNSILNPTDALFPNTNNTNFVNYPNEIDVGAADFFGKMFMTSKGKQAIGGSIQFANGIIDFL